MMKKSGGYPNNPIYVILTVHPKELYVKESFMKIDQLDIFMCMCVFVSCARKLPDGRSRHQVPWNWSSRWL